MELKTKVAQIFRKWADKLDPAAVEVLEEDYRVMSPHFLSVPHEIQTLMVKREILTSYIERYGKEFNIDKRMKEEVADLIAKDLLSHNSIKFTIKEKYGIVEYIGEVNFIQLNDDNII